MGEKMGGLMSFDVLGAKALNYAPCQYAPSRLLFRGPKRRLDTPFVAFVGGTETYGKFVAHPFPTRVEGEIGLDCINLGVSNAGVDVFVHDAFFARAFHLAALCVVQVVGAQNLSNRFFTVHPRRNDRFVTASSELRSIYPEVDFSEFHFNRHMLARLHEVSQERFFVVRAELQDVWSARMKLLLKRIARPVVLLWFANHAPPHDVDHAVSPAAAPDPMYITQPMLDALSGYLDRRVDVVVSRAALAVGTEGMIFNEMEIGAAARLPGPHAHEEVASALSPVLESLLSQKDRPDDRAV
ncbi:MAG: DUF6473 family protein [Pseudomonadota bacterium]